MSQLTDKTWWAAAGIRALKTVAQTAVASIGTSAVVSQVDWKLVVSASFVAGLLSILTSLAGLPEVSMKEVSDWEVKDESVEESSDESE